VFFIKRLIKGDHEMNTVQSPGRRALVIAGAVAGAGLASSLAVIPAGAHAQARWPQRPIRLVIPFAPGGSNDIIGRALAAQLTQRFGQSVVVENRGGGGGTIGTDIVAKSAPDGHTLLFASVSITTNAASKKNLPYDLVKDLQPIGKVASTPFAVVVSNKVDARTLKEFFELAKRSPKSISYGTAGIGGINHLGTELLAQAGGVELVHVPYKGIGPAFNDVMGGNLQMLLPTVASVVQHVRAGRLRALAVTSPERSPLVPDWPTTAEAGLPGFALEAWFGLLAPAGLPAEILARLNAELNAVLGQPEFKQILARDGAIPRPSSPQAFAQLIRSDIERWGKVIRDAGITLN
jgi:tripartite-type tricarboxylate transporter receptor subunit TctC